MKYLKSKTISIVFLSVLIIIFNTPVMVNDCDESLIQDLNTSGSWNLSPFVIDDTGSGDYTWSQAVLQPWCSGAGVVNNPYVIANIAIDGGNTTDCIVIRNSSKHFVIRNSTFSSAGWAGEPPYMGCITLVDVSNATLVNNTCRNSDGNGINIYRSNGIKIRENTLKNNERGISSLEGDSHKIINNSLTSNNVLGIVIQYGDNNQIKENTFRDGRVGVVLTSSLNNTVEANTIQNYIKAGVGVSSGSYNNIISENLITQIEYGIRLYTSHDNIISSNNISYSTDNGIKLDGINMANDNNLITGNTISNSSGSGIRLIKNCDFNRIEGNNIIDNLQFGIIIERSDCRLNEINNNYFITNGIHALDLGSSTYWNSSEIGNYWDNYTGPDFNDDGIGDVPHNITLSPLRQDFLPIWEDGDDSFPPQLAIITPYEYLVIGYDSFEFEIVSNSLYIDTTWYNVNGSSANYTFTGFSGRINQTEWDTLEEGILTVTFYANDSLGSIGFVDIIIEKDITSPNLIVHAPENGEVFSSEAPSFNITIIEKNFLSSWYSLDGGATNFSITENVGSINQTAWNNAPSGEITINFYAKDKAGNIVYKEISLTKSIPETAIPFELMILISVISGGAVIGVATLLLIRRKRKRIE